ncbi:MAG TPA: molybdopterin-dependent oxidoreductase [Acidimicrobiia bacterium]|nr:molybdopterin-dependent oxidoreductase [Acidimicrobiia bacterium]
MTETRVTYCRICSPLCGVLVDVEDGRVTHVAGDPDHPLTRGFTCTKGRHLGALHHAPDRFLTAQRNGPDGFEPLPTEQAVDEIAVRMRAILDEHGPEAIGLFVGTQTYTASLTFSFAGAWLRAVGSHKRFSTMTIDQSAKWVAQARLGTWAAGRQRFDDCDVWMLVGTNPLVSMQGADLTGFPVHDGFRRLDEARRRGLRLIVVDPRRTEVAAHADLHLQLVPGTDVALFAAILRTILHEGLHDAAFCAQWVDGLGELRAAVDGMTPERAAAVTGVEAAAITEAARVFGNAARGMAKTGTGPDMGPHANVAEHLVQALNVVCGRFPREGDRYAGSGVLSGRRNLPAQASGPARTWDRGYRSRLGVGTLMGELPSPILPDEILEPGRDRLRALVVSGGNPAAAFPDQTRTVDALRALELLVTVDPFPTETAQLAHYVIAPTMAFERADDTRGYEHFFSEPFAQYTPPILERPGDVIEDWEFFYELASRMGLLLNIGSRVWEPGTPRPSSEELLESFAQRAQVRYDDVRARPHGAEFDVAPAVVGPPAPDARARFDLLAADVARELHDALTRVASAGPPARPYLLAVRRSKHVMNSLGRRVPIGLPYNPCGVHPDDLDALGADEGALLTLTSDHGSVTVVAEADDTLRRGVLSLTHCYGALPGDDDRDPHEFGANPARLLSLTDHRQPVSLMPWMSAVPVSAVLASLSGAMAPLKDAKTEWGSADGDGVGG